MKKYSIKTFTADTTSDLDFQVNRWLFDINNNIQIETITQSTTIIDKHNITGQKFYLTVLYLEMIINNLYDA